MTDINRKLFIQQAGLLGSALIVAPSLYSMKVQQHGLSGIAITKIEEGEDVFQYILRVNKKFDVTMYREILGAANAFKEGDELAGLAAKDETSRELARQLLSRTKIGAIQQHDVYNDEQ